MAGSKRVSCGLDHPVVTDVPAILRTSSEAKYDFISMPIVHPRFSRELLSGPAKERSGPFTRSDLILNSSDWNSYIVGKLSPYIDVDHEEPSMRKQSELALDQELAFAGHLGLPAVMCALRGPANRHVNLARILHNKVMASTSNQARFQVWIHVPMRSPADEAKRFQAQPAGAVEADEEIVYDEDTWHWWSHFHGVADFEKKIGLALELSADLPNPSEINRWLGEPVRCLIVPTELFMTNKKGFPVLSRSHQTVIKQFFRQKAQILIKGALKHQHVRHYQQYMDHIWQNGQDEDPLLAFANGYEDYLQFPLQPLMDNLESQTYEVFEKDPVKYTEYQKAMYLAILDKVPVEKKDEIVLTLMVVGAGRGPLVRAALNAAIKADRRIRVYAVEKNPNAVVTLLAQQEEVWGDQVTVVSCDMREWNPPEKADILVSELLGSFGDNELSPECLDGAQKFLKDDGVSIPYSYTSFVGPIQSAKLYNEVRNCREKDKPYYSAFEMPYVVHLRNRTELAKPQALFTFIHPNRDPVIDNSRYDVKHFVALEDGVLHGLAGYFEAVLYKDVTLSINPATHSPGMFSWFPILFPIKDPIFVKKNDAIEVRFWRLVNRTSVWYEWCITQPQPSPIHNPCGRSYTIGL
nr:EOG090X028A [Triops cancriformis]